MKAYLVGGAVRDELLNRPVADRDWVVIGATPEELKNKGFKQVGSEFPCFLHPETKDEYALARTERKAGRGHTRFVCEFGPEITIEEDLSRRDLTINAIALSEEGQYIDPYYGREDLNAGILRHVSDAFSEDPLRVLRVARFAARYAPLGFTVHDSTMALMSKLVRNGEVSDLSPERVWKELSRALTETKPSVFFKVLRKCGALKVLLPELDVLFGVPQPEKYHPEVDTGEHVMLAVDLAKENFDSQIVTWAALVHDLGKGVTPKDKWPRHICHEIKGVPLVEAVSDRLRVPKDFRTLGMLVSEHHLRCHKLMEMKSRSIMRLLEAVDAIRRPQRLRVFVQACEADARGRLGLENKAYPQSAILENCGEAARSIHIQPLLDAGLEGLKLAEQIRRLRITKIAKYMSGYRKSRQMIDASERKK